MKAIGYIRVSTDEQGKHGVSLDAQTEKIKKYASYRGIKYFPPMICDEAVSGSIPLNKRAGGKDLLRAIEKNGITDIIITKQDRLFRDTIDCLSTLREWDELGIVLHIIDEGGVVDTSTPNGWMQVAMRAIFADYEVKQTRHRTKTALAHKKENGQVYNHIPYGFRDEGGRLIEDEQEQANIKSILILKESGMTLQEIADRLNKNGIPAKKGGKWHPQTVKNVLNPEVKRQ